MHMPFCHLISWLPLDFPAPLAQKKNNVVINGTGLFTSQTPILRLNQSTTENKYKLTEQNKTLYEDGADGTQVKQVKPLRRTLASP